MVTLERQWSGQGASRQFLTSGFEPLPLGSFLAHLQEANQTRHGGTRTHDHRTVRPARWPLYHTVLWETGWNDGPSAGYHNGNGNVESNGDEALTDMLHCNLMTDGSMYMMICRDHCNDPSFFSVGFFGSTKRCSNWFFPSKWPLNDLHGLDKKSAGQRKTGPTDHQIWKLKNYALFLWKLKQRCALVPILWDPKHTCRNYDILRDVVI